MSRVKRMPHGVCEQSRYALSETAHRRRDIFVLSAQPWTWCPPTCQQHIVFVRGIFSHERLRKDNGNIDVVSEFCHPSGIASPHLPVEHYRGMLGLARQG